jgi:hypothetical protein
MSAATVIHRDERTVAVENASYRWAYLFLSFGLLALVAFRGFARSESAWDMLALVVLGGVLTTAYQAACGILSRQWAAVSLLTVAAAAVMAALMTWLQ